MEKGPFSDEKIINLINAYFTPIKVKTTAREVFKTDKGEISTKDLVRSFKIRGVPATFFLKPDGTILINIPGYKPSDDFELVLKYIGEDHYKDKNFSEYLRSIKQGS